MSTTEVEKSAACAMGQHAICPHERWDVPCECGCHPDNLNAPEGAEPQAEPAAEELAGVSDYKARQAAAREQVAREKAEKAAKTTSTETTNEEDSMGATQAPSPADAAKAEENGGKTAETAETPAQAAQAKKTKYRIYKAEDLKDVPYAEVEAKTVPAAIRAHAEAQGDDFKGGKFEVVAAGAFSEKEVKVETKRSVSFD